MTRKIILLSLSSALCFVFLGCSSRRSRRTASDSEIQSLIADLDSSDSDDRYYAAEDLQKIGPAASAAVPKLLEIVKKENEETRVKRSSLEAIGRIEKGGKEVDEQLLRIMDSKKDDYSGIRSAASSAFQEVKTPAKERAEVLLKGFYECAVEQQRRRCYHLTGVGVHAAPVVPFLLGEINKEGGMSDSSIVKLLGAIGPAANAAIPDLLYLTEKKYERRDALKALRKIGAPRQEDLSLVLFHANSRHEYTRLALLEVLRSLGKDSKKVMSTFIKLLDDPSAKVRLKAVEAIGEIGPDAKSVLPKLGSMKKNASFLLLKAIEKSIQQIKGEAKTKRSVA